MYIEFGVLCFLIIVIAIVICGLVYAIYKRNRTIEQQATAISKQLNQLAEQDKHVKQLSQYNQELTDSLKATLDRTTKIESELCDSKKQNASLEIQIAQLKKKSAEQDQLIKQLTKSIDQLTSSLSLTRNQVKSAEEELRISNKQNQDLKKKTEQLTASLSNSRSQAESAEEALRDSKQINLDLKKQGDQLTQDKLALEKQVAQLQKDVAFYTDITAASDGLNEDKDDLEITLDDLDAEQRSAFDLMIATQENLFITGKAGTGKSALLKVFVSETTKCVLKLAPTGIAAINIDGATLHSAFGFDNLVKQPYDQLSEKSLVLNSDKKLVLQGASTIIIDEISMVRADTLEKIDRILKIVNECDEPFGGKQMILFGDLFQLPPVAKPKECSYLNDEFGGIFFYNSMAYEYANFHFIELTINHRQTSDQHFFNILNNIREGIVTDSDLDQINSRTSFEPSDLRTVTRLFSKKEDVDKFNRECLEHSPGREFIKNARVLYPQNGVYPRKGDHAFEINFPISEQLRLKKGSLVMFVKNNGKKWANGTIGIVSEITDTTLRVSVDNEEHDVFPTEFEAMEAKYVKGKITYEVVCRVSQYPVVLAYAMTIHKAQGQTYGKIACDVSDCFAPGQAYVALSRVKKLEGLFLLGRIERHHIQVDSKVNTFYVKEKIKSKILDEKTAEKFRRACEATFEIVDHDGETYRIRSGKNIYTTSSTRCTCDSFKYDPNRRVSPCKHMLWLALRTGVLPPYYLNQSLERPKGFEKNMSMIVDK